MLYKEKPYMIRKLKPDDAPILNAMMRKIKNFNDEEIDVAMELVNVAAKNPQQTDYNVFVYTEDKSIVGYHCVGLCHGMARWCTSA